MGDSVRRESGVRLRGERQCVRWEVRQWGEVEGREAECEKQRDERQ
jgi:hypothetical protein